MGESIAVVVVDRDTRTIDWDLFKVGTTVAIQLSVEVGEQTTLEKRILGKVDTTNNVARLELSTLVGNDSSTGRSAYHDLLCLGKVVQWITVELHFSERSNWNFFHRKNLGWIQQVKSVA